MNLLTAKHTEFLKWVLSKNIKIRGAKNLHKTWTVSLNRVTEPDWLDPAIMPKSSRLEIDRAISFIKNESKRFGDTKNITDMYLGNLRDLRNVIGSKRTPKMIEILKWKLDKNTKLFKRDYYKIFPELKDIVDENNEQIEKIKETQSIVQYINFVKQDNVRKIVEYYENNKDKAEVKT